jgi:hypothetical protein
MRFPVVELGAMLIDRLRRKNPEKRTFRVVKVDMA